MIVTPGKKTFTKSEDSDKAKEAKLKSLKEKQEDIQRREQIDWQRLSKFVIKL
jgi:hypothetical protein